MSRVKVFPWLLSVALLFVAVAADAAGITKRKNPDGSTHYEYLGTPSDAASMPASPAPQQPETVAPATPTPTISDDEGSSSRKQRSKGSRRARQRSSSEDE